MKPKMEIRPGDKVLAKVKGYPPWPATVDDIVGKKYLVTFYGTKETSKLKLEELSDFLENKDKLKERYPKKKDLMEAIKELEFELNHPRNSEIPTNSKNVQINEPESDDDSRETEKSRPPSASLEKRKKRSLSSQSAEELPKAKRAALSRKSSINSNADSVPSVAETSDSEKPNDHTLVPEVDGYVDASSLNRDYEIVFADDLYDKLLATSKYKKTTTTNKNVNGKPEPNHLLLLARLPKEPKFIGIRCSEERHGSKTMSDSDVLQHNDNEFRNALNLKNRIEVGELSIDKIQEQIDLNPQLTTKERLQAIENSVVKRKQARLHWLQLEAKLVEYDSEIKSYLGLDKADCDKAIQCLEQILNLAIEPLMLTKHPHVVEMVRRLRRYIGNVKDWNLTPSELVTFKKNAEIIQKKADEIYQKFKKIYKITEDGRPFTDFYNEKVKEFNEKTKHMKEGTRFAVCGEPGTILFEIDQTDDLLEAEGIRLKALIENRKQLKLGDKSDEDVTTE